MTRAPYSKEMQRPHPARRRAWPYRPWLDVLEERLPPTVSLTISTPAPMVEGDAGTAGMLFTVTRLGDMEPAVQVEYATRDGTAVAGVDYQATSGTLRLASYQTTATIVVPIIGNRIFQNTRTFTVALSNAMPSAAFAPQRTFATNGMNPRAVAAGDFNGDGRPDLAVADSAESTVSVLLNTTPAGAGIPSFGPRLSFGADALPFSMAVQDINGDGRPDIATANYGSRTAAVLLNTTPPGAGAPSFTGHRFAVGNGAAAVALRDVNGDGLPDLVVGNGSDATVSVLLNQTPAGATAPSFAAQRTFAGGRNAISLALADLNGDGRPDVIVAHRLTNQVSVLVNQTQPGAGVPSFSAPQGFSVERDPYSVAVGDLNGDGRPDLAVGSTATTRVSVLLNETLPGAPVPAFAPLQTFATIGPSRGVAMGDVNGDGRLDLATAPDGGVVGVLLNTTPPGAARPRFASQQWWPTTGGHWALTMADFNGDGQPDLALCDSRSPVASVLLNTRVAVQVGASFLPEQTFPGVRPSSVAVGDLNGDGKPDLAVTNWAVDTVSVFLNSTPAGATAPSFGGPQIFVAGAFPVSVAVGDLNGDGKPDLAFANFLANTASALINTTPAGASTPSFAPVRSFAAGARPTSVALGDFNGDSKPDLAVANSEGYDGSVFLNLTPPGATVPAFAPQQTFDTSAYPSSVAVGDVNGDGKPDLTFANEGGDTISVLLNTTPPGAATPSFAPPQTFSTGARPRFVASGDFNGDGRPDLAVASFNASTVSVFLNGTPPGASTPSFAPEQTFSTGVSPRSVAIGDVNGDGRPDLAVANYGSDTASVLVNTTVPGAATPSFAPQRTFATRPRPGAVAMGEFNADGQHDLAVGGTGDLTVSVLLNNVVPIVLIIDASTGTILDNDAPASISIAAGNNQPAHIGSPFRTRLAVDVRNAAGSLVERVSVTFTAPATGPSGTFPGSATSVTVVTTEFGRATAPTFTANLVVGRYAVTARASGGVEPSTNFALRNIPHRPRLGDPLVVAAAPSPAVGPLPVFPPRPRSRGIADPPGGDGAVPIQPAWSEWLFATAPAGDGWLRVPRSAEPGEWDLGDLVGTLWDEEPEWF